MMRLNFPIVEPQNRAQFVEPGTADPAGRRGTV